MSDARPSMAVTPDLSASPCLRLRKPARVKTGPALTLPWHSYARDAPPTHVTSRLSLWAGPVLCAPAHVSWEVEAGSPGSPQDPTVCSLWTRPRALHLAPSVGSSPVPLPLGANRWEARSWEGRPGYRQACVCSPPIPPCPRQPMRRRSKGSPEPLLAPPDSSRGGR